MRPRHIDSALQDDVCHGHGLPRELRSERYVPVEEEIVNQDTLPHLPMKWHAVDRVVARVESLGTPGSFIELTCGTAFCTEASRFAYRSGIGRLRIPITLAMISRLSRAVLQLSEKEKAQQT